MMCILLILTTVLSGALGDIPALMIVCGLSLAMMLCSLAFTSTRLPHNVPRPAAAKMAADTSKLCVFGWTAVLEVAVTVFFQTKYIGRMFFGFMLGESGSTACGGLVGRAGVVCEDKLEHSRFV